jgi:anti-sigma regulatory factor (Ser/Thr protein kinase)
VTELFARAGVPATILARIRLAVSEAVGNAVLHGYRGRPAGDVTVVAEAEESAVKVLVRDDGCGMSPRPDSPGAGLGLPLIGEIAESVSVAPGRDGRGTELRMTFELPPSG